jgi:hypothetical protein
MPRTGTTNDDPPQLSIEDTSAARIRLRKNSQAYELLDAKQSPRKKRTDLRKLSEWIRAQRRAEEAQRAPVADSPPARRQYVLFMSLRHLVAVIVSALHRLAGRK